jgi:hypothetical protein
MGEKWVCFVQNTASFFQTLNHSIVFKKRVTILFRTVVKYIYYQKKHVLSIKMFPNEIYCIWKQISLPRKVHVPTYVCM